MKQLYHLLPLPPFFLHPSLPSFFPETHNCVYLTLQLIAHHLYPFVRVLFLILFSPLPNSPTSIPLLSFGTHSSMTDAGP